MTIMDPGGPYADTIQADELATLRAEKAEVSVALKTLVARLRELVEVTAPKATSVNPEYQEGLSNAYEACADKVEEVVSKLKEMK